MDTLVPNEKVFSETLNSMDEKMKIADKREALLQENLNNFLLLLCAYVKESMLENGYNISALHNCLLDQQLDVPTTSGLSSSSASASVIVSAKVSNIINFLTPVKSEVNDQLVNTSANSIPLKKNINNKAVSSSLKIILTSNS